MEDDILQKVIEVVHVVSGKNQEILPTTQIINDNFIDSLSVFNVILNLEKVFGVRINPMDATIDDFETPESIARLVSTVKNKENIS